MDEIDRAAQREQEDRERAIAAARSHVGGLSLPICSECGDPIPSERQRAVPGVKRCIDCQQQHEILLRTTGNAT